MFNQNDDETAPNPVLFKQNKPSSSLQNIWKGLFAAIGASKDRPFLAGKKVSATLNFASTNAQLSRDLTIPCVGAKAGDLCILGSPPPLANSSYSVFVSAAGDEVTVRLNNYSSTAKDPDAGVFTVTVIPAS